MDIAERRKPQDGQLVLRAKGEDLCFRISVLPTVAGEKCVVRLLKKEGHLADLGRLGFAPAQLAVIRAAARLPQGLVLVTGPTGSGKTTTLHAMINDINEPDINIVTVEDPVEQAIEGVNHVEIKEKGGVTFASGLRSILRQDPDVVFVGEMRDEEVSRIAIKASMTGHLVLSTLHTNGVIETFNRLTDMNLEPYLLASCLKLIVAQRLLRRTCTGCAQPAPVPDEARKLYDLTHEQVTTAAYRIGKGCDRCMNTGYKGRVGVYEMLSPNDDILEVMRDGGDEGKMLEVCERNGVMWMKDSGVRRALAGETTFEEVKRVLAKDAGGH